MEKEIVVNGKTYNLKELKYKDVAALGQINQEESAKKLLILSTGVTEEEYNDLSMRDGIEIQKAINELNGFGEDFQKPLTK
ncbi:MAG: phage tail assembly protein [Nanoarchaeota archaeon]|nr:phage tail assembly protein [Nanoarchaeota archaeon]